MNEDIYTTVEGNGHTGIRMNVPDGYVQMDGRATVAYTTTTRGMSYGDYAAYGASMFEEPKTKNIIRKKDKKLKRSKFFLDKEIASRFCRERGESLANVLALLDAAKSADTLFGKPLPNDLKTLLQLLGSVNIIIQGGVSHGTNTKK